MSFNYTELLKLGHSGVVEALTMAIGFTEVAEWANIRHEQISDNNFNSRKTFEIPVEILVGEMLALWAAFWVW